MQKPFPPDGPQDPATTVEHPERAGLVARLTRSSLPRLRDHAVAQRRLWLTSALWSLAVTGLMAAILLWLQADTRTVVATFKRSGEYSWMPLQNVLWGAKVRLIATRRLNEPWTEALASDFENARDIFFHRVSLIVDAQELANEFRTAPSFPIVRAHMLHARDELDKILIDGPEGLTQADARLLIDLFEDLDPLMTQFMTDLRNVDLEKRSAVYDTLMARRDIFRWATAGVWLLLCMSGTAVLMARTRERNEAQARREALDQKLAAMQTAEELIETRNSILNMVAHDLRSPLQVLMSTAETLQMKLPQEQTELIELVQQIDGTIEQITTHLRDLNLFAKALDASISTQAQSLDLDEVAAQAFGPPLRDAALKKHVAVHVAVDGMKRGLQGDRTRITQILGNLIDNAIKYTDSGSVNVLIETRPLNQQSVMLTFSVTDTGIGMGPSEVKKAFQPFVRLGPADAAQRPGYGLGLSLVKHLVEMLHGSMEVRSTPGIGSAFVVRLPTPIMRSAGAAGAAVSPDAFLEIKPDAATVMVVDDVPEVLNALIDSVKRQGAVALGASNAAEAVALASVHTIHLALIDYQMPVRNGLSLAAELSRRHPAMHLVLISAFPEPEIFSEAALRAVGARGFAEKPLKGATIRRLIDDSLPPP